MSFSSEMESKRYYESQVYDIAGSPYKIDQHNAQRFHLPYLIKPAEGMEQNARMTGKGFGMRNALLSIKQGLNLNISGTRNPIIGQFLTRQMFTINAVLYNRKQLTNNR